MQLDAAPLEAAFLQNVARRRIGNAGARDQVLGIELLEEEINRRARSLSTKTLAPMLDAQPIAELRCVRLAPVDADHAKRRMVAFDQEHGVMAIAGQGAHEFDGVIP